MLLPSFVLALLTATAVLCSPAQTLNRRASRTSPPSGAVVVRPSSPGSGEFTSLQAAVNSLPNDKTARSIFIYSGTYTEQVTISRSNITIYGYTTNTADYTSNTVNIQFNNSAAQNDGNDEKSSVIQILKAGFAMYNINVRNLYGQGSQALAVNADGDQQGYYGVGLYGYQDTLRANSGNQFYGHSYIEGAVDFIWGGEARAFITRSVIASVGKGCITANGRAASSDVGFYVIDNSTVIQSANSTTNLTGQVFLGRPWRPYARVAFAMTSLSNIINPAGWQPWSSSTPNTANSDFIEFNNTGAGTTGPRASFSNQASSDSGLDIASILGSNYTKWVDLAYL